MATHTYDVALTWSGSSRDYRTYDRTHEVAANGVQLRLSADAAFRGDPTLLNPELLVVAAASSCQLLSFLAVASRAGVEVVSYEDDAEGVMPSDDPPVRLTEIRLRPHVRVRGGTEPLVLELLETAHEQCYVASSLRSEIRLEPTVEILPALEGPPAGEVLPADEVTT